MNDTWGLAKLAWELIMRSGSLHESFLNSHVPVKREQELHESWWELRRESLHESFLNSHVPVNENKSCIIIIYKSWEARVCMRVFSTLLSRSNENKSCMRVENQDFAWEYCQLEISCPRLQCPMIHMRKQNTCSRQDVAYILNKLNSLFTYNKS
jgi:hypothetical protein